MASLLHWSGLRLMGCLRLRVKDVGLPRLKLKMRDGKGECQGATRSWPCGRGRHNSSHSTNVEPRFQSPIKIPLFS
jgi:hypothetical protein